MRNIERGRTLKVLSGMLLLYGFVICLIGVVNVMLGFVVGLSGWNIVDFGGWIQILAFMLASLLLLFLIEYAILGKQNSIEGGLKFAALLFVSIIIAVLAGPYIKEAQLAGRALAATIPIIHVALGLIAIEI